MLGGQLLTHEAANMAALTERLVQKRDLPQFEPVDLTLEVRPAAASPPPLGRGGRAAGCGWQRSPKGGVRALPAYGCRSHTQRVLQRSLVEGACAPCLSMAAAATRGVYCNAVLSRGRARPACPAACPHGAENAHTYECARPRAHTHRC